MDGLCVSTVHSVLIHIFNDALRNYSPIQKVSYKSVPAFEVGDYYRQRKKRQYILCFKSDDTVHDYDKNYLIVHGSQQNKFPHLFSRWKTLE